jgi:hypothetical protein
MAATRYWCLVINHEKKLVGNKFSFKLTPEVIIDELKKVVKSKMAPLLDNVDADELTVWRCKNLLIKKAGESELSRGKLERHIKAVDFSDTENNYIVDEGDTVASLSLAKNELLLVQMPGIICFIFLEFCFFNPT